MDTEGRTPSLTANSPSWQSERRRLRGSRLEKNITYTLEVP